VRVLIVRPAPGNKATADAVAAMGLEPVVVPLFEVVPVAWEAPEARNFDAVVMTSANAARHGGPGLAALTGLDCLTVGEATAAAARAAGFRRVSSGVTEEQARRFREAIPGIGDAAMLAWSIRISPSGEDRVKLRLLHLAGVDHLPFEVEGTTTIPVYDARTLDVTPPAADIALVHSARAGARLTELMPDRAATQIVAISPAAARACGTGWAAIHIADTPREHAMLACLARLCEAPGNDLVGRR
jgi:uroporphyrinogen-III synthase